MNQPPGRQSGRLAWDPADRSDEPKTQGSIPQTTPQDKRWEDRPGWASCFPPKNANSKVDFTGVTVIDGQKFWVNVYKKLDRNGNRYVSVNIRAWDS